MGLTAKTLFLIAALLLLWAAGGAITLRVFDRVQATVDDMVGPELDQLMSSVRLIQQAEALTSQSLMLVQSETQLQRQAARLEIDDRLDWLRKSLAQARADDDDAHGLLRRVDQTLMNMTQGIDTLDTLVQTRISLAQAGAAQDRRMLLVQQQIAEGAAAYRAQAAELSVLVGYFAAERRGQLRDRGRSVSQDVRYQQRVLTVLALAVLVMVLSLVLLFHGSVVRRILKLQRAVARPQVDPADLYVGAHDEITRLAETVRGYVQRIQANEAQMARTQQDLAFLAAHDPLTQLPNRRHFEGTVSQLLAHGVSSLALVMIDIDWFKRVNDTYGHEVGDQALVHVAQRLQALMRQDDVLARFGGEEFVLALSVPSLEVAGEICERIRLDLAQQPLWHLSDRPIMLTLSFGVALLRDVPTDISSASLRNLLTQTLAAADAALYQAKRNGRNQVCVNPAIVNAPDAGLRRLGLANA
ncbi:MAG: hypothetical protein OHK0048_10080 [Rhodoferax sp.]